MARNLREIAEFSASLQTFADIREKAGHQHCVVVCSHREQRAKYSDRTESKREVGDRDSTCSARGNMASAEKNYGWQLHIELQHRPRLHFDSGHFAETLVYSMSTDHEDVGAVPAK
jgi:hypothetical protein